MAGANKFGTLAIRGTWDRGAWTTVHFPEMQPMIFAENILLFNMHFRKSVKRASRYLQDVSWLDQSAPLASPPRPWPRSLFSTMLLTTSLEGLEDLLIKSTLLQHP
jgi:hypothetical protein